MHVNVAVARWPTAASLRGSKNTGFASGNMLPFVQKIQKIKIKTIQTKVNYNNIKTTYCTNIFAIENIVLNKKISKTDHKKKILNAVVDYDKCLWKYLMFINIVKMI